MPGPTEASRPITEVIRESGRTLFSFEILPPKKGEGLEGIFRTVEALLPYGPSFIDVTSHPTEVELRDAGEGLVRKVAVRKRPGTLSICGAITYRYGIPAIPHLICSGFTTEETEDALIELSFLGLNNIMALRGDPSHGAKRFEPTPGGHSHAHELVAQIKAMNGGKMLHDSCSPTQFCIGVAGYPEKHMESPNPELDIERLKAKVDAGADFVVTQMFFDNAVYFEFVERCRAAGIGCPIIPGLKPLTSRKHLSLLPHTFHIDIPRPLADACLSAEDDREIRKIGRDWCIRQSADLKAQGAPCLHYYTMGRAKTVSEIAEAVFGRSEQEPA